MKCEQYKELLPLYITGDLEQSEAESIARHLEGCTACRSIYDSLRETANVLKDNGNPPLSELEKLTMEREIYRRLVRPETGQSVKKRWLLQIAAGIALFFLGFGARYITSDKASQPPLKPIYTVESTMASAEYKLDKAPGMRLSSQGLKLIARGKSELQSKDTVGQ